MADLPWDNLQAQLSPNATLIDTSPSDYVEQCLPVFEQPEADRSQHDLIDQPSGLCMNQLYCGFVHCNPVASDDPTVLQRWETLIPNGISEPPNDDQLLQQWLDKNNSNYNLPSKVLFPRNAGDVVAAVEFAQAHPGLELSIKNSGHSYTGASTKKDTLHLNMNQYHQYSPTGLVNCSALVSAAKAEIAADLSNQPCQVAMARNKPAVVRVGGGENFDKVYRAVAAYNQALPEYKYHLVGGAAGTVSPMGWTFQGGLSGTTGGRMFGFGVDQVVQIDMVLPNGKHVRFGPVEWEDDPNYVYPKTTKVSGVCHENPYEQDESKWQWSECPADADKNFDDLWFAVRGGGGGTFGIVTSVYLQIHEYLPISGGIMGIYQLATCGIPMFVDQYMTTPNGAVFEAFGRTFWNFVIDFFLNPSAIDISQEDSSRCGGPALLPNTVLAFCYGKGAGDVFATAWQNYVIAKNQTLADEMGMSYSDINKAAGCLPYNLSDGADYAEMILIPEGLPHAGKCSDSPKPSYASTSEASVNLILPKSWILENQDMAVSRMLAGGPTYWAFGGQTTNAHDQTSSLSTAHRNAGMMQFAPLTLLDNETFWSDVFPTMYNTSDGANFPGFVGSNHAGPNTRGPLQSDWTKPCPLNWTESKRDARCVPLQEAIWGTATLRRLESIKQAMDPNYMLDCNFCIGNNRPRVVEDGTSGESPGGGSPTTTKSSAANNGILSLFRTGAAIAVATILQVF